MKVKFWGVRGSVPCPGSQTVKYGGNTSCLEMRIDEPDRIIIIDAGSGIRELGNYLMSSMKQPIAADLFFTHTHMDHIVGFPFFTPLYIPGTKLRIYGPATYGEKNLESIIGGQMSYHYFPVRLSELSANITYIDLKEETFDVGDGITVTTKYLNHPLLCLGYRFEYKGKIFCTTYDTEPYRNVFVTDKNDPAYDEAMAYEGEKAAEEENRRLEDFFSEADLLVYDTQYTLEEYESSKIGWGHAPVEYAIETAARRHVKRLALFHHDPSRNDVEIDALTPFYCHRDHLNGLSVFFAREGMEVEF
ncbi:MAG: MBL fold metallo-hydrolase [Deltaproteobacteria bacterium]|nr:MBL fold metallo-hydrolase [Deltaproteobacteria bacterium]